MHRNSLALTLAGALLTALLSAATAGETFTLGDGHWDLSLFSEKPLWGSPKMASYESCVSATNPDPIEAISQNCQIRRTIQGDTLRWKSKCHHEGIPDPTFAKGRMRSNGDRMRGKVSTRLLIQGMRIVVHSDFRGRLSGPCE